MTGTTRPPDKGAVRALVAHAGSSLICALVYGWTLKDVWFVLPLKAADDVPFASGSVGPPVLLASIASMLSVILTLAAAFMIARWVLAARAHGEARRQANKLQRPQFVAAIWFGVAVAGAVPGVFIFPDDPFSSVIAFAQASCWGIAMSILMFVTDLAVLSVFRRPKSGGSI